MEKKVNKMYTKKLMKKKVTRDTNSIRKRKQIDAINQCIVFGFINIGLFSSLFTFTLYYTDGLL